MDVHVLNLKLIKAIEKHDCIYDIRSEQYKKFKYKEFLWKTIAKEIGIRSSEAKNKWKNFRDNYKKYRHAVNAGNRNRKQYKYAEALRFLDNTVSSKRSYNRIIPISDAEVSTELSSEEEFIYEKPANGQTENNFQNQCDEMQDFSDTSSTNDDENIVKDNGEMLTTTANNDENLTAEQKTLNNDENLTAEEKTVNNDENLTTEEKTLNNDENLTAEEKNGIIECSDSSNSSEIDLMEQTKEKDLNELLIEEVKKYDCFYNLQSHRYKHYSYKNNLWHKIGKRVGLHANQAYRKWKSIRDCYRKYKIKSISKVGFVKPYKYAESLKFLDDYTEYPPPLSRVINEPEVSTDLSSDGDVLSVSSSKHKRKKGCNNGKVHASSAENIENEPEHQKTMTSRLFMVLANKINESNLTAQQINSIEFGVSSLVYSKLAEYINK